MVSIFKRLENSIKLETQSEFHIYFSFCLEKHSELKISICCQSPQVNKFTRLSKHTIQDFAKEGKIARGDKF